jgi:amino-acid N-acetyltransferase
LKLTVSRYLIVINAIKNNFLPLICGRLIITEEHFHSILDCNTLFMIITEASPKDQDNIIALLRSQQLPSEDLPEGLPDFYVAHHDDKVTGIIGMELYGASALLRSMVVHPAYRNRRIAEDLVKLLEQKAISKGIGSIYLLTETAENYFKKKGYEKVTRQDVPAALFASTEFSHVCPASATVMKKQLPG